MNSSLLNFPERGPWGSAAWPGNASGHVYRTVFESLRPALFVDPMVGSGTSIDVAREMGIRSVGLDLHAGFNVLRESILQRVGEPSDLCLSHPPYHDMVVYSGEVFGDPHPDDLSRCASVEDFLDKLQIAVLNQRDATRADGHYGVLIGDLRREGRYHSFQSEIIARMPSRELASVLIKVQHNVRSDRRVYRLRYARVVHEYLVLWKRSGRLLSWLGSLDDMARQQHQRMRATWRAVVYAALTTLGGEASLNRLYATIEREAPEHVRRNRSWREKVRQTLQLDSRVESEQRGVWRFAA